MKALRLQKPNLVRVLLSIFIVIQLLTIFICPNPESILYSELASSLVVYGNLFGLNTTWRFFSPNPGVRLLEYDVFTRNAAGQLVGESFRYPKSAEEEKFREIYGRKVGNEMFVVARNILPVTLGPQLCKWHPGAETIAIYLKGRNFSSIEKSRLEGQHVADIGQVTRTYLQDVHCDTNEKL